jgi:hypothetical protein
MLSTWFSQYFRNQILGPVLLSDMPMIILNLEKASARVYMAKKLLLGISLLSEAESKISIKKT